MDAFLGLLTLAFVAYFVFWEDFLRPLLGLDKPKSVKRLPTPTYTKPRSRVPNLANATNAGSVHQKGKEGVKNVPANVPGSVQIAPIVPVVFAPSGTITISQNELHQLAAAVAARSSGATIDESIFTGFGLKKGGGPSYRRARDLFDAATQPPGATG
jgi:hypothetical protein